MASRVICPQCNAKLRFEKDVSGRSCECPKCKTRFRAKEAGDDVSAPEKRAATDTSQPIPRDAGPSRSPRLAKPAGAPSPAPRTSRAAGPPEVMRRQRFERSQSDAESSVGLTLPQWNLPPWTLYAGAVTVIGLVLSFFVWLATGQSSKPQLQVNHFENGAVAQSAEPVAQPAPIVPESPPPARRPAAVQPTAVQRVAAEPGAVQPAATKPQTPNAVVKKDASDVRPKPPLKVGPWRILSTRLGAMGAASGTRNSPNTANAAQAGPNGQCTPGSMAPEIEGRDLDGARLRLSDYRGKVVMLEFWAGWCPYCRKLFPYERDLIKKMRGRPFALLGVNVDKKADAKAIARKKVTSWRSFQDGPGGPIGARWGVTGYPHIFILDHKGTIRFSGYTADPGHYTKVIEDLLDADELKNASVSEAPAQESRLPSDQDRRFR